MTPPADAWAAEMVALAKDVPCEELAVHIGAAGPLAVLRFGWAAPQEADPLLVLHGWLDNLGSFLPLLRELAKQPKALRRTLYLLDIRGHGRSVHGEDYGLLKGVADIFLVADALGFERFGLVGHSLGGNMALLAAGTCPERVTSLMVLDAIGPVAFMLAQPGDVPASVARACEARVKKQRGLRDISAAPSARTFATKEEAAQRRAEKNLGGAMRLEHAALLTVRGLRGEAGAWRWASDPRLLLPSLERLSGATVLAFCRRIQCPTTVVVAADGILQKILSRPKNLEDKRGRPWILHPCSPLASFGWALAWAVVALAGSVLQLFGLRGPAASLAKLAVFLWVPVDVASRLQAIGRVTYLELGTGGHHLHMARPEVVAGLLHEM